MSIRRGEIRAKRRRQPAGGSAGVPGLARPIVRGAAAARAGYRVEFDARPVFDFLLSPGVLEDPAHDILPDDRRWLETAFSALEPADRAAISTFLGDKPGQTGITTLAIERPDLATSAQLAAAVQALTEEELARRILRAAFVAVGVDDLTEPAVRGDAGARAQVEAALREWGRDAVLQLLDEPSASVGRLRDAIGRWQRRFQEVEERVAAMLARDVAERKAASANATPVDIVEDATGGIRWLPDGRTQRVILAPSYFGRPYNHIVTGPDWRLFCYPLSESAIGAGDPFSPPPAAVRLHRALGDETRLRILRLLRDGDLYLTEIATRLDVSKPTVKHHLALLRAAGLVTMTHEGALTYYSLRTDRLEQLGAELRGYLV